MSEPERIAEIWERLKDGDYEGTKFESAMADPEPDIQYLLDALQQSQEREREASLFMGLLLERLGGSVEIQEAEIVQFDGTVTRINHFNRSITFSLHPNTEAPKEAEEPDARP